MPRTEDGFLIDATVRDLDRRLTIDLREMFVALAKAAVDTATLNPMVFADVVEMAASVKRTPPSLETRAWMLIRRALGLGMARVIGEAAKAGGVPLADPEGFVKRHEAAAE